MIERLNSLYGISGNPDLEPSERAISSLVHVLGIINSPSTADDIAKALPRTEAFEALGKIGTRQALDFVIPQLNRWYAQNLRDYDPSEHQEEIAQQEAKEKAFERIFNGFDNKGRDSLKEALTAGGYEGKDVYAKILGTVGDESSIDALENAVREGDFLTKKEAASALKKLKAKKAVPTMVAELLKTETYTAGIKELEHLLITMNTMLMKQLPEWF